jgi:hypothetical protein
LFGRQQVLKGVLWAVSGWLLFCGVLLPVKPLGQISKVRAVAGS